MREHMHLKIGEFARVGQVTIATLRHYDQCGLLKPNTLDPEKPATATTPSISLLA